jgi:8-hydroxy-5-deazaflavin:NADPH oxidoreductase
VASKGKDMKIGILGAGMVGRAFAAVALKHGHDVMLSNSRTPDTLFTLRAVLNCKIGSPQEATAFGDIVLVAIPLKNYASVPVTPLEGKIVIDANNYYPERDGHIRELDREETTTSELLARHLPKSKIVKALNAIEAPGIEQEGRLPNSSERRAHPIAGDDPAAKQLVADLLNQFGFDVVDAGPLAEGRCFQKHTPAYCVPFNAKDLRLALARAVETITRT